MPHDLIDLSAVRDAYFSIHPDAADPAQKVAFGTSGHRGSSLNGSFNEDHIAAITQAIVEYRAGQEITGPVFVGKDTHALSDPAQDTVLEVLAGNGVAILADARNGWTPTPALSHAILTHNADPAAARADGILITPSHNPPADGGLKYNPPHGGPADTDATSWIADRANELLANGLRGVKRTSLGAARLAGKIGAFDFMASYVNDLPSVLDLDAIRNAGVRIGADPMGGASVDYWAAIAETHRLDLTVVNPEVDPRFAFMSLDTDGKIRMDCSSASAMASLIAQRNSFDIATGNDADADRHGIVTPDAGLMNPNHFLAVAIEYLYSNRTGWSKDASIGKTLVSSSMIDRVAAHARPQAGGGPGGLQVVRAGPAGRLGRLRRRGIRRRIVPAQERQDLDHRQGRHHHVPAGQRNHRNHRLHPVACTTRAWPKPTGRPATRASTPRPPASRRQSSAACRPPTFRPTCSPANPSRRG